MKPAFPKQLFLSSALFLLASCNSAFPELSTESPNTTFQVPPSSEPSPEATLPSLRLDERPQIWFGPLPPSLPAGEGRPFTGSVDYMDLFVVDAPWQEAGQNVNVFLLYGEWVGGGHATDQQLKQIVSDLQQRGIALAVEGSPLLRPSDCGAGFESWGGIPEGLAVARRVQNAGGTIHFWAMDAPLAYASLLDEPGACRWPIEKVVEEVANFVAALRTVFPDIVVGDTEPLWAADDNFDQFAEWMNIYREIAGENLPFFHLDVDFGHPTWPQAAKELEILAREQGIEFGIFYGGNWEDPSDQAWLTSAGERAKAYELLNDGKPDHVLLQSWQDHPDYVLPDTQNYTFTNFVNRYAADLSSLGVQSDGPGANLAYGSVVRTSNIYPNSQPEKAIDGIYSTWWGAGDFPPQWIEIDLGAPRNIAQIRLAISQDPDGETTHRVWGRGPDSDYVLLIEFREYTLGTQILEYTPPESWMGIQFVKVSTDAGPSWVSWREIEIISE